MPPGRAHIGICIRIGRKKAEIRVYPYGNAKREKTDDPIYGPIREKRGAIPKSVYQLDKIGPAGDEIGYRYARMAREDLANAIFYAGRRANKCILIVMLEGHIGDPARVSRGHLTEKGIATFVPGHGYAYQPSDERSSGGGTYRYERIADGRSVKEDSEVYDLSDREPAMFVIEEIDGSKKCARKIRGPADEETTFKGYVYSPSCSRKLDDVSYRYARDRGVKVEEVVYIPKRATDKEVIIIEKGSKYEERVARGHKKVVAETLVIGILIDFQLLQIGDNSNSPSRVVSSPASGRGTPGVITHGKKKKENVEQPSHRSLGRKGGDGSR